MKGLLLFALKCYKTILSPILPPSCRFYPSCSQYAYDAIKEFGVLKGVYLSTKRVLRCNPFCKGGYDPVVKKGERIKDELS